MPGTQIEWDDEKVARLWDHYASNPTFQSLYFARVYGRYVLRRARLPAKKKLDLIDFGCGPGYMWEHVHGRSPLWTYYGLEFSAKSVEDLRRRADHQSSFGGAVVATGLPSELPSDRFDAALLLEVVEHLNDEKLAQVLSELWRILKPGAALVVTAPHNENLDAETLLCPNCSTMFHRWQHVRSWNPVTLQQALECYGFREEVSWVGHWDDHHLPGWVLNRAFKIFRKRRTDVHFLSVFRKGSQT